MTSTRKLRRWTVNPEAVGSFLDMAECDACGDDLGIHEWVATLGGRPESAVIVDCDRS